MTDRPTREQILSEPAGPRLDAWVAELVMGCTLKNPFACGCPIPEARGPAGVSYGAYAVALHDQGFGIGLRRYSSDIGAAWAVVDEMARKTWNAVINDAQDHRRLAHGPLSFEIQTNVEQNAGKPPFVFVAFERPGGIVAHRSAEVSTAEGTTSAAAALAISRCALLAVLEDEQA